MFKRFENFLSQNNPSEKKVINKKIRRVPSLSNEVRSLVLSKIHYDNLKQELLKESNEKNQEAINKIREDYRNIKNDRNK